MSNVVCCLDDRKGVVLESLNNSSLFCTANGGNLLIPRAVDQRVIAVIDRIGRHVQPFAGGNHRRFAIFTDVIQHRGSNSDVIAENAPGTDIVQHARHQMRQPAINQPAIVQSVGCGDMGFSPYFVNSFGMLKEYPVH